MTDDERMEELMEGYVDLFCRARDARKELMDPNSSMEAMVGRERDEDLCNPKRRQEFQNLIRLGAKIPKN